MELDPAIPPPPAFFGLIYEGRYCSAKIDDISLSLLQAMREFLEETTRNQEEEDDEVAVQLKTSRPSPSPDNRASYAYYFVQGVEDLQDAGSFQLVFRL